MNDQEFGNAQLRLARLASENLDAVSELLAEVRRRELLAELEAREPGTVHPIRRPDPA